MTLDEIKAIIKEFDQSGLSFLEFESNETRIKLKKSMKFMDNRQDGMPIKLISNENKNTVEVVPESKTQENIIQENTVFIKAPLVGVFYEKSEPNTKPYVTIGQKVKKGEVVCLIEAMKMINEVTAPVNGIVKRILIENESLVSFGEMLMEIEEQ